MLGYLRGIASLVSDSAQYVTLSTITNTRKRIVVQSLLTPEDLKCSQDRLILSLFSERETAPVIDFIKNEVIILTRRQELVLFFRFFMKKRAEKSIFAMYYYFSNQPIMKPGKDTLYKPSSQSKVFERLVRFSDFRGRLITMVANVQCTEESGVKESGVTGESISDNPSNSTETLDKSKDQDGMSLANFLNRFYNDQLIIGKLHILFSV